jgi:hypothetical protein
MNDYFYTPSSHPFECQYYFTHRPVNMLQIIYVQLMSKVSLYECLDAPEYSHKAAYKRSVALDGTYEFNQVDSGYPHESLWDQELD